MAQSPLYRTAPGSEPPALVGRDDVLEAIAYEARAAATGEPAPPIIALGLRGMGKTALLRRAIENVRELGAVVISVEASDHEGLSTTLQSGLERAKRENASVPARIKAGFDVALRAFPRPAYELPNDAGAISLTGGGGEVKPRFESVLEDLNDEVRNHGKFLVFAIDEIQEAPVPDFRELVRFIHRTAGTERPVWMLGAGLPNAREHLHAVRTYTERWRYFPIGLLTPQQTIDAIALPAAKHGVTIAPMALDRLAEESAGYPFFVQKYAAAMWAAHTGETISLADVDAVIPGVRRILDNDFYEERFRVLTPRECAYALAMADLGTGPHTPNEIAARLNTNSAAVSSIRNQLVKKNVAFAPAGGLLEFRIPLTERYIAQHRDLLERRAREAQHKSHNRRALR